MISVIANFCRCEQLDEIVVVQLFTSCCKDRLVFKLTCKGHYINLATQEEAEGWNRQLKIALEEYYGK